MARIGFVKSATPTVQKEEALLEQPVPFPKPKTNAKKVAGSKDPKPFTAPPQTLKHAKDVAEEESKRIRPATLTDITSRSGKFKSRIK
jgi:hypothetical protein